MRNTETGILFFSSDRSAVMAGVCWILFLWRVEISAHVQPQPSSCLPVLCMHLVLLNRRGSSPLAWDPQVPLDPTYKVSDFFLFFTSLPV